MINKKTRWIFVITVLILGLAKLSGLYLDNNADKLVQNMHIRNADGIIKGSESISIQQGSKTAILMIHGFADSPAIFFDLIDTIKEKSHSDIYAPLLPFHGRNLQYLSKSNNQILLNYINQEISVLAKKYTSLTIIGMSYGGALLAKLAYENKLPKNLKLIFYSPAFYIKSNDFLGRTMAKTYSYWRKYCNYKILGCSFPNYASVDDNSQQILDKQPSFKYVDIPALLTMYRFDLNNRIDLAHINRPYNIIIAANDNRVVYDKIKTMCHKNRRFCTLYTFPSGRHLIHLGKNKEAFASLLLKINYTT